MVAESVAHLRDAAGVCGWWFRIHPEDGMLWLTEADSIREITDAFYWEEPDGHIDAMMACLREAWGMD